MKSIHRCGLNALQTRVRRGLRTGLLCALLLGSAACTTMRAPSAADPLEGMNRSIDNFNQAVDTALLKPVARGYNNYVAPEFRTCARNFFSNLEDVVIALNNLLQAKPIEAASDICRVLVNSTIGILGFADVASELGLKKHNEDFGQTLGYWGVGPGPYVVLPLLGPSTLRDAPAAFVDAQVDLLQNHRPVDERNVGLAADIVDTRAELLPATDLVDRVALDKYSFVRDAYLNRRASLIRDGAPAPQADGQDELQNDELQDDLENELQEEDVQPGAATEVPAKAASGAAPN